MNLEEFLRKVQPGMKLQVTFLPGKGKRGTIDDNMRLALAFFGLMQDKNIILKPINLMIILAVVQSGYWDHDENRTMTIQVPEGFDAEWFWRRLDGQLESIAILGQQPVYLSCYTKNDQLSTETGDPVKVKEVDLSKLFRGSGKVR